MKLTKGLPGLSSGSVPGGSGRPEAEGEAVGSADAVVFGAGGASPTGTSDGAAVSVGVGGAGSSSIEGGRQGVTREEGLEFYADDHLQDCSFASSKLYLMPQSKAPVDDATSRRRAPQGKRTDNSSSSDRSARPVADGEKKDTKDQAESKAKPRTLWARSQTAILDNGLIELRWLKPALTSSKTLKPFLRCSIAVGLDRLALN